MKSKILSVILSIILVASGVLAYNINGVPNYYISKIAVDDSQIYESESIFVERGQTVDVDVWFTGYDNSGLGSIDSTRVRAWIGGYEYDEVEAISNVFEVSPGVSYKKTLQLKIPSDLDGSKDYTLHVEVYDDQSNVEEVHSLRVEEKRHSLTIEDTIFSPDLTLEAGKNLFANVRIKNDGDKKEEDIKVKLSIPKLGISTRAYLDELAAHEIANTDEEDSGSINSLYLKIPENTKEGNYDVVVEAEYNNGHDVVSETYTLSVKNDEAKVVASNSMINVDSSTKKIAQGEGSIYKISFANLESNAKSYSVEVSGADAWATTRVDPSSVTVQPDKTADAYVYLAAKEDASVGTHMFTVRIKSGDNVIKELNLGAEVTEATVSSWDTVKLVLEIIFIILLVALIAVGTVIGIRKYRKDEGLEEPSVPEAQTYYMYPSM